MSEAPAEVREEEVGLEVGERVGTMTREKKGL